MKYVITTLFMAVLTAPAIAQTREANSKANPAKQAQIFTYVEQMPEFPGGSSALMEYLSNNIQYPKAAQDNNTTGRVLVKFVVMADGSIANATVVRGIGDGCDEEALRVIKKMPRWKPGRQNGQAVNVYFTQPINFQLTK